MKRLFLCLMILAATASCSDEEPAGAAKEPPQIPGLSCSQTHTAFSLRPFQSRVYVGHRLCNKTKSPILVERIDWDEFETETVHIVEVALAPATSAKNLAGIRAAYPPAVRIGGECQLLDVHGAEGFLLSPGASAYVVVWVKSDQHGSGNLNSLTLVAQHNGQTTFTPLYFLLSIGVGNGHPPALTDAEASCLAHPGVQYVL